MKKIYLIILLVLLLTSCSDEPDVLDIIIKTNEKYKNMQDFKAIKIVKERGYIITSIKEVEIKGNKYKIIEDDEVEVSDGENVWKFNINGPEPLELSFPENNSELDLSEINFILDKQGNYKYVFQIDEKKDFTSFSLPHLIAGKRYYWRVYPIDINGRYNESFAEVRTFKVKKTKATEFESTDYLPKIYLEYDNTKSKAYIAFPISENLTENPLLKKGNFLLKEIKDLIIDRNKVIIDETVKPYRGDIHDVQNMGEILNIYARNFKLIDIEDNFYVVEGKTAKDRLTRDVEWNKIKAWINKEEHTVGKIEFYDESGNRDFLFVTIIYEDISFNNNFSDEHFIPSGK